MVDVVCCILTYHTTGFPVRPVNRTVVVGVAEIRLHSVSVALGVDAPYPLMLSQFSPLNLPRGVSSSPKTQGALERGSLADDGFNR